MHQMLEVTGPLKNELILQIFFVLAVYIDFAGFTLLHIVLVFNIMVVVDRH